MNFTSYSALNSMYTKMLPVLQLLSNVVKANKYRLDIPGITSTSRIPLPRFLNLLFLQPNSLYIVLAAEQLCLQGYCFKELKRFILGLCSAPHHRTELLIIDPAVLFKWKSIDKILYHNRVTNVKTLHQKILTWSVSTSTIISLMVSSSPIPYSFIALSSSSFVMKLNHINKNKEVNFSKGVICENIMPETDPIKSVD